jgi:hypothetical protein
VVRGDLPSAYPGPCELVLPVKQSDTMAGMRYLLLFAGVLACVTLAAAPQTGAQASAAGSIEFQARIQPSGGRLEPARGIPFFLLSRSVADIHEEAARAEPSIDIDGFVDSLSVSPELKAWMKNNHTVALSGTEFTKKLSAEDITGVPEFLEAFLVQNGGSLDAGVPVLKSKEKDRVSNPGKYQRDREQYIQAIKRYLAAHPESTQALDAQLGDSNASQRWAQRESDQQRKIQKRSQLLAQTAYLSGQVESDLDGRGAFSGLAPGTYWLTTLDTPAMAGDISLQWDVPVQVVAGRTARIELSNLNAVEPAGRPLR